jgi:hypothetical protein
MASFVADTKLQAIAEAYARDTIRYALAHFQRELDGTDDSIGHVEAILHRFHERFLIDKPTEQEVFEFAKGFGSYGEVYRNNHGATWGIVTLEGETYPGLEATNGVRFWPWARAQKRITDGPEENMWHYYQLLVEKGDPGNAPPSSWEPPVAQRPWWKKWFGV